MKMLIIIPSKQRAYNLKTLKWLNKCKLPDNVEYRVFVEPSEYIHYRTTVEKKNLVKLPENDKGLGYSLMNGHLYAKEHGFDLCFHLDDDVNGFIDVRAKMDHKIEVFEKIVNDLPYQFNDPDLFLIRFLSAKSFYFVKNDEKLFCSKNQPAWGCYIARPKPEYYSEFVKTHSDTVAHIRAWQDGYYTLTYGLAGISVDVYTNKGGCQARDRKQDGLDTVKFLKENWLPEVYMEDKDNTVGYDINIDAYKVKPKHF